MAYIALFRKYRSQSFAELMGQEHVTRTLQNAIRSGHIAQAYLFHGARGCGKTSTARLIARALNCIATDKPNPEPCGVCQMCISIREGTCLDVVEIDAASETGVDNVREKVIENVQYAPAEARYKVYIIDEVHDLSSKAFDALLKTIEEPPAHVVFVLATTEYHKVPITIRSRCQQYQFKRGGLKDLAAAIKRVVDGEGFTAEPEAILSVARAAEGSWRDALSLLEQVMAYSDGKLTSATVQQAIGAIGAETLERVTETLAQNSWSATLAIAAQLTESGADVRQLISAMAGHLRDLLLIASGASSSAAEEMGQEKFDRLSVQAALYSPDTILAMLEILSAAEKEIRFTNHHRLLLERTLCRMMPDQVGARNAPAAVPAAPSARPVREHAPPLAAEAPMVVPRPVREEPAPKPLTVSETEFIRPAEQADPEPGLLDSEAHAQPTDEAAPDEAPQSRYAEAINLDVIRRQWPRILKLFQKASPSGYPWLEKAVVLDLQGNHVILGFDNAFAMNRIQGNAKGKALVQEKINEGLNTVGYGIRCELIDGDGPPADASSTPPLEPAPTTLMELDPPEHTQTAPASSGGFGDFALPDPPAAPSVSPDPPRVEPTRTPDPPPADHNAAPPASATKAQMPAATPPAVKSPAPPPVETGMLQEALSLLGGEVIQSDPL